MGLLDLEGKMLLKGPGCLYRLPNGSGDILARLIEENLLQYALDHDIEYITVVSSNNLTEPMIDCLSLGWMHHRKLDGLVKAVDG
jgi:UDP-N-acetylglucosamine pyrophosphorylase